ncbi:MAG: hypothetical protein EXR75_04205 [Myxococcales bacterium]|nr:hypothetical protein [Myxococcales bacterium]
MTTRKHEPKDADGRGAASASDDGGGEAAPNERVLHTRVPAVLEKELKRLASALRVPVSNVVRTILADAVDTIDSMGAVAEGELRGARARLRQRLSPRTTPGARTDAGVATPAEAAAVTTARVSPPPPLAGIIGFQPLWLARPESCSLCGRALRAGEQAYFGVREIAGGVRVLLDPGCLPASVATELNDTKEES